MQVKVKVTKISEGIWDILTGRGHRIGQRLITVSPKAGEVIPEVPAGTFTDVMDAHRVCLEWNLYLAHAWKHRSKSKDRVRE
jgi:hypothetical protein